MQTAITYLIAAKRCEIDELEKLNRICGLVRVVSELVQHLQSERGISNLYLTSKDLNFATRWERCLDLTDRAKDNVQTWLSSVDTISGMTGGSRLFTRIAVVLHALEQLPLVRASVQGRNASPAQLTERYSQLISSLLALVFDAADISVDPEISRLLVALFNLMQGKEFVGRERALGTRIFASNHLGKDDLKILTDLIELQEQCFDRFESFCGESILTQWHALQTIMPLADIERMRRKLFTPHLQADPGAAEVWFNCCSKRIDDIFIAEQHLTESLQQSSQVRVKRTQLELNDQQSLLAALSKQDSVIPGTVLVSGLDHVAQIESLGLESLGSPLTRDIFELLQKQTLHLQSVSQELATVKAALDERKLIERAKGVLMSHHALSEDAAYRLLRDKAMNQNRRLVEVAESVLSMADFLPKS